MGSRAVRGIRRWRERIGAGAWVLAIVVAWLIPPPLGAGQSLDRVTWSRFWQVFVTFLVGLLFVVTTRGADAAHAKRWLVAAATSIVLSIVVLATYIELSDRWSCDYAGERVVVGDILAEPGIAFVRDRPTITCKDLVWEFGGRVEQIWTPDSIDARRRWLGRLYQSLPALFASSIFLVVQARTLSRATVEAPTAAVAPLSDRGDDMAVIRLEPGDVETIREAFATAFNVMSLHQFVTAKYPKIAGQVGWFGLNIGLDAVVAQVVDEANRRGVLDRLITDAASEFPIRPDIRALVLYLSRRQGWGVGRGAHRLDIEKALASLEALTAPGQPFVPARQMAHWLTHVERQVCQITCGQEHGSGFLVGDDLVLTCYHVVASRLKGNAPVSVRFDYHETLDGKVNAGSPLALDDKWDIPNAPYSQADITLKGEPAAGELDYALLKLATAAGREVLEGGRVRGWIDLSGDLPAPDPNTPMLIVQHPGNNNPPPVQLPLQVSFDTPGFEALNPGGTRMVYTPSTEKGSSGSPVFDGRLRPAALHHNRGQIDPNAAGLVKNNRGIPLAAIKAHLPEAVRALLVRPPA